MGIYVDDDQTIYVADYDNHRIVKWKSDAKNGQIVAGGNGKGNRPDQLNMPTDIIVDNKNACLIICDYGNRRVVQWPCRNGTSGQTIISDVDCYGLGMDNEGHLYISDCKKHEVRRWRIEGSAEEVVAGGNGQGTYLDQLDYPTYIFIDKDHSIYVSDLFNCRVMKWTKGAKEGVVVAGGLGSGTSVTQLSEPGGIFVDELGTVYVTDSRNNRIMRWSKGTRQGSIVVGETGEKKQSNQLHCPVGLSFDQTGNLYVGDINNNRVQKFNIDSTSSI
jgi:sugar lactone lactonase YvrE